MQDTNMPKNRVIIIGGDHHNGLGLARIFGLNGKKITAIIVSNKKRSWMATSKFIESHKIFSTEKDAFDFILETYSDEPDKPVLIPYSDGAAMELDLRLNQFKENFYVLSINGEQGRIAALMDKDAQYKWAKEHGIKMAESAVVDVRCSDLERVLFPSFPCIVKPNNSAESQKKDISICSSNNDLLETLKLYKKGYTKALIQEYLNIEFELDVLGGIVSDGVSSIFPHQIIRRWPEKKEQVLLQKPFFRKMLYFFSESILNVLQKEGFVGLYDMELFKVRNCFYLNEINFRNSGNCFRTISQRFFYAPKWVSEIVFGNYEGLIIPDDEVYSMTEYTDFRHVAKGRVGFFSICKRLFWL